MSKTTAGRMHFDDHAAGANRDLRAALCGFLVSPSSATADPSLATCRICLARLRKGVREVSRTRHQVHGLLSDGELAAALHIAVEALDVRTLAPTAGFPPRMTPERWAASCKGGEHRRCGECELCEWERSAQLWEAVSPWNRAHQLDRVEGAPRWPSLGAALLAAVEFEKRNRCGPSALGGILDRLKRGESGSDARDPRKTDPSAVVAAMDIVHVQSALERAYPTADNDNAALSPVDCARVLLARTAGVLASVTSYEALTQRYGVSEGTLRAIVKQGRERITEDLAARGLIPYPRPRARVAETMSTMRGEVDEELPSFDREAAHA